MDISRAPVPHVEFLSRALPILERDPRFVGVAAGGSWIFGELDEFSDLDLVLAISPPMVASVYESRMQVASSLGTLLSGFTGEHVGEPRLIICLYDKPLLHVDLKFTSLDEFEKRVEDPAILWERDGALARVMAKCPAFFPAPSPQWVEDRFWVWVHYAATKIGRGELFEVVDFLAFLREQALGPLAAALHGQQPRGMRKVETRLTQYVPAFERTLATLDPKGCVDGVLGAVQLYRELREAAAAAPLTRRLDAERISTQYLASIAKRVL